MNLNTNTYRQYQNYLNMQLSHQNKKLNEFIQNYKQEISNLEQEIQRLTTENKMLREFLDREQSPLEIENLYLSFDTNLKELRINSLQSGSALNIGKLISNTTNSDMDMKMGDNSMNSGDANSMEHMNSTEESESHPQNT
ncbi:hypothetical protein [Wukongibacter sp. M2B1]|uniref:hypothetical protein n=1 Tax=Wukongibacter sp. M2B1 TaxID=3088895 RepID=UPI003D7A1CB0